MMSRSNRLRRAGLVLALLVLAAIVTGAAASAAKTVVPNQLTGRWGGMVVGRRGKVSIHRDHWYHLKISHATPHPPPHGPVGGLSISGMPSCSGTGRYWWTINGWTGEYLNFHKIHDACKQRVDLLTHYAWGPHKS